METHSCTYNYIHAHANILMCMQTHSCTYNYIHVHANTFMCTQTHSCAYNYIHVHAIILMCMQTHSCRWFYSREDACIVEIDMNMPKNANGTFFICPSPDRIGTFQLSVLDDRVIHRYTIRNSEDDVRWFLDTKAFFAADQRYNSLEEIVVHYTHNSGLTTRLSQPCPRIMGRK